MRWPGTELQDLLVILTQLSVGPVFSVPRCPYYWQTVRSGTKISKQKKATDRRGQEKDLIAASNLACRVITEFTPFELRD